MIPIFFSYQAFLTDSMELHIVVSQWLFKFLLKIHSQTENQLLNRIFFDYIFQFPFIFGIKGYSSRERINCRLIKFSPSCLIIRFDFFIQSTCGKWAWCRQCKWRKICHHCVIAVLPLGWTFFLVSCYGHPWEACKDFYLNLCCYYYGQWTGTFTGMHYSPQLHSTSSFGWEDQIYLSTTFTNFNLLVWYRDYVFLQAQQLDLVGKL